MIASVCGGDKDAAVALAEGGKLLAVCSQERATRRRRAGLNETGLADEALALLLHHLNRNASDIRRVIRVSDGEAGRDDHDSVDHHFAHACTAYLTSGLTNAAIVICDHELPYLSVWKGVADHLAPIEWAPQRNGFAGVYSRCAAPFGFPADERDQRLEGLARLRPGYRDGEVDAWMWLDDGTLRCDPAIESRIEERIAGERDPGGPVRTSVAAALQGRLIELFIGQLKQINAFCPAQDICLGGSFFYNSSLNSAVRQSAIFRNVFIPVDPGNSGLAVGAACHATGMSPANTSPFMGPSYTPEQIKATLDNCKLQYTWESEEKIVAEVVAELRRGRLVGWFDDHMEWGPRALGARSILANPASPYVLENLNRFLKRREPWRGYAFCTPEADCAKVFSGPVPARFMECDFRPHDPDRFKEALPDSHAAVRVQTIGTDSLHRFRSLMHAFGEVTGCRILINSSFNGFHEPIVCTPRDAVRVFYGTGLDLLVIDQFVIRK